MCLQFKKKRQGYHVTFLACFSSLRITVLCCFQHLKIVSFFPQFTASPWQIIETGVLFLKQNYKHKRKWIIHFQIPSQYSNFFEKINWINICLASFLSSFRPLFTFYLIRGVELVRGSSLTYPLWWDEIWTEKEERKQALQASGWKAFQKDSSACVDGLDSGVSWRSLRNGRETSVAAAELIRERRQRRGTGGANHTRPWRPWYSWDD